MIAYEAEILCVFPLEGACIVIPTHSWEADQETLTLLYTLSISIGKQATGGNKLCWKASPSLLMKRELGKKRIRF